MPTMSPYHNKVNPQIFRQLNDCHFDRTRLNILLIFRDTQFLSEVF